MNITTDDCVVRLTQGERISEKLAAVLDEVNIASLHAFAIPADRPTELHYHDFDEYWYFSDGTTTVTLRRPDGTSQNYAIGPGDLIVTPAGVEHGHVPDGPVKGLEWTSRIRPEARRGHLYRET
jgi:mannose-6-phosphate isomerase-like protein (cupin superfamily)